MRVGQATLRVVVIRLTVVARRDVGSGLRALKVIVGGAGGNIREERQGVAMATK